MNFIFWVHLRSPWGKRCRRLLPFFVIVLIVPILLLRTPHEAIGVAKIAGSDFVHHIDITKARGYISRHQYFLTELNVIRTYIRLLLIPVNQNFDYDYPISSKMDTETVLSGLFLFCLLAISAVTFPTIPYSFIWYFMVFHSLKCGIEFYSDRACHR